MPAFKKRARSAYSFEYLLDKIKGPSQVEIYPEPTKHRRKYRVAFGTNSTFVSTTHFIKSLFGPTILAMPCGFMNGGWMFSVFGFTAILALVSYNMYCLVENASHLSERESVPVRTYGEYAYVSFNTFSCKTKRYAKYIKLLVNILFFITYLDACTIFMIFVGRNVEAILQFTYPKGFLNVHHLLFCQVIFGMGLANIRELKYLTPFSFIASILLLVAVGLTVQFFVTDYNIKPWSLLPIGTFESMLRFFPTVLFGISGIAITLTIKSSMARPEHFFAVPGVFLFGILFLLFSYVPFGFLGYMRFGADSKPSILLNLPVDNTHTLAAKCTTIVSVFLSSPLVFYVAFNVIWNNYLKSHISRINVMYAEFVTRYILIIVSYSAASVYPHLGTMIVLKGAIFHSVLEIILPAILNYMARYPEFKSGKYHFRLIKALLIFFFGAFCFFGGVTVAVLEIVRNYYKT